MSGNRRAERQTLQRRCCMSTILKWAGNKTAIMPELKKYLPAGPRLVTTDTKVQEVRQLIADGAR
ncbi:hypothetical protein ACVXJO_28695, partial [Klebsiella pneumoniae]